LRVFRKVVRRLFILRVAVEFFRDVVKRFRFLRKVVKRMGSLREAEGRLHVLRFAGGEGVVLRRVLILSVFIKTVVDDINLYICCSF